MTRCTYSSSRSTANNVQPRYGFFLYNFNKWSGLWLRRAKNGESWGDLPGYEGRRAGFKIAEDTLQLKSNYRWALSEVFEERYDLVAAVYVGEDGGKRIIRQKVPAMRST
jgi:hypothetical protein